MRTSLNLLQNTLCNSSHIVQSIEEEEKKKEINCDALSFEFHLSQEFGHQLKEFCLILIIAKWNHLEKILKRHKQIALLNLVCDWASVQLYIHLNIQKC